MTADEIITRLNLAPHSEGGWFRQTWIADNAGRASGTCIYFLLKDGERSHWHRVDATEIWLWHAGAPLTLSIAASETGPHENLRLGNDLAADQEPQGIVPADWWQAARPEGGWTLVSCTVSPGFRFEGFELAPPDFDIPD
jgi:predicted cupin superfamily sugar epimerase